MRPPLYPAHPPQSPLRGFVASPRIPHRSWVGCVVRRRVAVRSRHRSARYPRLRAAFGFARPAKAPPLQCRFGFRLRSTPGVVLRPFRPHPALGLLRRHAGLPPLRSGRQSRYAPASLHAPPSASLRSASAPLHRAGVCPFAPFSAIVRRAGFASGRPRGVAVGSRCDAHSSATRRGRVVASPASGSFGESSPSERRRPRSGRLRESGGVVAASLGSGSESSVCVIFHMIPGVVPM